LSLDFRVVGPGDTAALVDIFGEIDATYFRPHPFTRAQAGRIAAQSTRDIYALLLEDGRPVAYGMLRGWSEGYEIPSLGIAVRTSAQGHGLGQTMMRHLHAEANRVGATVVRLRVHPRNVRARRLYESLGYAYAGEDRGELVMLLDLGSTRGATAPADGAARELRGRLLDGDAPEWRALLACTRHDFHHLPEYASLSAAQVGGRPGALHVTDGARTLLLPLLIRAIAGGDLDAISPYGYPGPIGPGTEDPGFVRVALAAGCQVLRDAGLVSALIRLHPLLNAVAPEGIGVLVHHGETVSIDLTLPAETLWSQTRLNHRRDIIKATNLGFVARMDDDWTHFGTFKRLYRETMERRSAAEFYFFSDAYFDQLRVALGETLRLCVVEKDDEVAAAGLFVETDGIVEYYLSGSDTTFGRVQPTKLLIHFAARWARDRGDTVLHLGGGVGGAPDSLFLFKSGFSALRHPFATLRIVFDEAKYERLSRASHPEIDPARRSGFFPLYRLV
jgi:ribosomal protein S18 acetylase RimI-like enzyme